MTCHFPIYKLPPHLTFAHDIQKNCTISYCCRDFAIRLTDGFMALFCSGSAGNLDWTGGNRPNDNCCWGRAHVNAAYVISATADQRILIYILWFVLRMISLYEFTVLFLTVFRSASLWIRKIYTWKNRQLTVRSSYNTFLSSSSWICTPMRDLTFF